MEQAHCFSTHFPVAFSLALTKSRRFMFLLIYTKYSDVWEASTGHCVSPHFLFCMMLRSVLAIYQSKIHNVRKHDYIQSETPPPFLLYYKFNHTSVIQSGAFERFGYGVKWRWIQKHLETFNSCHGILSLDRNSTTLSALSYFVLMS